MFIYKLLFHYIMQFCAAATEAEWQVAESY